MTIPRSVAELIGKVTAELPYQEPEDLVFYGEARDRPIHAKRFIDSLYAALAAIGIDEEKRKARSLDFHNSYVQKYAWNRDHGYLP
ncbi:MAG TPA: hypothetical protein VMV83_12790 [Rectinemataceae bacterium]|nr:hypothetical protein [Rectinemataceae bacterium]